VLVTGATGRVGRVVVDLLIDAGVPVRALSHRSEAAATLPANVTEAISIGSAFAPFRMAELRTEGGYDEFPSQCQSQLLIPIASNPTVGFGRAPERSRPAGGE
jgi:nucleoside-diphosphate-sugar epimerase